LIEPINDSFEWRIRNASRVTAVGVISEFAIV